MSQQALVFTVLGATLVLFVLDRWRYDVVALLALLSLTVLGVIPGDEAFAGFGHPAVVTVAAILVVSRGLANSGLVEHMSQILSRVGSGPTRQVAALTVAVAVCSAFMNNVGALALLMPVALRIAARHKLSPSLLLMPLAFGSLLGGMTTLIGTPPNIIIGSIRAETGAPPFGMFAFAPVGLGVALLGLLFITFLGWRLIPQRQGQASATAMFEIEDYTTELTIPQDSPLDGKPLRELAAGHKADFVVVAIARGEKKIFAPAGDVELAVGDSLIVEVEPTQIPAFTKATGLHLASQGKLGEEDLESGEVKLVEAVVVPRAHLQGKTAEEVGMRATHGLNLLAVARQGSRIRKRLKRIRFAAGDVLLMQARDCNLGEALSHLGCLPLAERDLRLFQTRRIFLALGIFGAALLAIVLRLLPAQVAFAAAAVVMVLTGLVTLRGAYRSIDWPIIVLLGGMIPVGGALESSGGAALIASKLAEIAAGVPAPLTLALVMVLSMFLSDVMNNAATAVIMAPISISVAESLGVSSDPFLMAVAIGASCAFLTPIGHQSNTLVMGPGGYRFGDYWRLGLPLEILIVTVAVPMLLWIWPLSG